MNICLIYSLCFRLIFPHPTFTSTLCIITQLRGDAYHNLSSKSESGWNNCIGGCFIINTFSSVGATASLGNVLRNLKWAPYLSA